jgi:hypothetical protein
LFSTESKRPILLLLGMQHLALHFGIHVNELIHTIHRPKSLGPTASLEKDPQCLRSFSFGFVPSITPTCKSKMHEP